MHQNQTRAFTGGSGWAARPGGAVAGWAGQGSVAVGMSARWQRVVSLEGRAAEAGSDSAHNRAAAVGP
jgi:hypothetical protein